LTNDKITLYEYLASSVPSDAHFVINKYGNYRRARDKRELEYQLKNFVKQFGENGLNALADIHPDKQLLQINCNGCSAKKDENIKSNFVNASGNETQKQTQTQKDAKAKELRTDQIKNSQILIFGGMILMAFAIMIKK
tara:strand:+ start:4598 stop:5011 length:414 start_codon:yes stop_codon:yes gene_type:complete